MLIRRSRPPGEGRWTLPGGRVEYGETLMQAVVRELVEETALEGVCGPYVGCVERIDTQQGYHYVVLDFAVTVLDDRDPAAGSDALDACWVPLDEVSDLDLVDGLVEFLADHHVIATIT